MLLLRRGLVARSRHLRDIAGHGDRIVGDGLQAGHDVTSQLFAVAASLVLDCLSHVDGVARDFLEAGKNRLDDLLITIVIDRLGWLLRLRLSLTQDVSEVAKGVLSDCFDLA